jgi:hypothetical protein
LKCNTPTTITTAKGKYLGKKKKKERQFFLPIDPFTRL